MVTEVTTHDNVRLHVNIFTPTRNSTAPLRDIVLMHGWPNSGRVWETLIEHLQTAAPFRCIVPTFRGFGESEKTESGYTCNQFADDVVAALQAVGATEFALVGHSMGGKIAQLVAARQPVGLTALVLVCPVPLIAAPVPEEKKAAQRAAYGDAQKTEALLGGMASHPLPGDRLRLVVEDGLNAAQAAWNGWIDPMREEDFRTLSAHIKVPTRVYQGAHDPLRTMEAIQRDVVDPIPGATLEVLPNVGHLPHLEEPSALALPLVNFLDEVMR